jgi:hypothetical protein
MLSDKFVFLIARLLLCRKNIVIPVYQYFGTFNSDIRVSSVAAHSSKRWEIHGQTRQGLRGSSFVNVRDVRWNVISSLTGRVIDIWYRVGLRMRLLFACWPEFRGNLSENMIANTTTSSPEKDCDPCMCPDVENEETIKQSKGSCPRGFSLNFQAFSFILHFLMKVFPFGFCHTLEPGGPCFEDGSEGFLSDFVGNWVIALFKVFRSGMLYSVSLL